MKIICRNSVLSLIQANKAKALLEAASPGLTVEILVKPTRGDLDTTTPLYEFGDKNLFTNDIDNVLLEGKADFAVHSLKDLSADRWDNPVFYSAVFERDDPRDVILFNENIVQLLKNKVVPVKIRIGTSSLRRQELVPSFLNKIFGHHPLELEVLPIRGNVDTRLRKLRNGEFDAIVLAAAGLNRLLQSYPETQELLKNARTVFLPLIECAPAAGQGALVIECLAQNEKGMALLQKMDEPVLKKQLEEERIVAGDLGAGCHQRFGVVYIPLRKGSGGLLNIAGKAGERDVTDMLFSVEDSDILNNKKILSATDFMRDFFNYEYIDLSPEDLETLEAATTVFVAHHRTITEPGNTGDLLKKLLHSKKIWVSGTRTWAELAKETIWVEGCADGFGFDFLEPVFESPLAGVNRNEICILTNESGIKHWKEHKAVATYRLIPNLSGELIVELQQADAVFWTNFEQYEAAKNYLKPGVLHLCSSGKTADLFEKNALKPIVFPGIKSFLSWWRVQDNLSL